MRPHAIGSPRHWSEMVNMNDLAEERDAADLLSQYSELLDTRQFERIGDLFASDAEVEHGFRPWWVLGITSEDQRSLSGFRAQCIHGGGVPSWASSSAHGRRGTAHEGGIPIDQPADLFPLGVYVDDLRKVEEGWRVQRRRGRKVGSNALTLETLPEPAAVA